MGKKIRIRDEQPGAYLLELINNFFGRIRNGKNSDPEWKKFGSGTRNAALACLWHICILMHSDSLAYTFLGLASCI
jgi:hypothetical protein